MLTFPELLRQNRNYRRLWIGQIATEVGHHFNTIAVFSLVLENTRSGLVVSGVMLARAAAVVSAGPIAGVALDRWNRRNILVASNVFAAIVAACFIFMVEQSDNWPIYALSGLLMCAVPFFNSGRTSILPTIASPEELHTANALTQTTRYATVTVGTMLGGTAAAAFGYKSAFLLNAACLLFSGWIIARMRLAEGDFKAPRKSLAEAGVTRPWHEYKEGLRYLRSAPLMLAIALMHVAWATGGGAAQILFSLFGELVFERGPAGIGTIWSFAGVGLLIGGAAAHRFGSALSFDDYKKLLIVAYAVHGAAYVVFSQAPQFWAALAFIALSRAGWAFAAVLNLNQLLVHVDNSFRGRVFSTIESMTWATMTFSLAITGVASEAHSPRTIGAVAGALSSLTAVGWSWAYWRGKLTEPPRKGIDPNELEVDRLAKA